MIHESIKFCFMSISIIISLMKRWTILIILVCLKNVWSLDNGLGLTPAMGWNTWNKFACNINQTLIMRTVDLIESEGYLDAGYVYMNLDDCWASHRNPLTHMIYEDFTRFPSGMGELGRYIHRKGLKFGIYSDAGFKTCAGKPGSLFYEKEDAIRYRDWGVDYLKYDNCYSDLLFPQWRYKRMQKALNQTGRPIFYSMCEWGIQFPWLWAEPVANSWRITQDIKSYWPWIELIIERLLRVSHRGKPGGWNDPDMLEVGIGNLTEEQEKTHFAIWAITKSPLIIGCDLENLRQRSKRILLNKQIIAINQDPLGVPGRVVAKPAKHVRVITGPLSTGQLAVVIYNRKKGDRNITFKLSDISWSNSTLVRDLYQGRDLGRVDDHLEVQVKGNGVRVFKLTK